MKVGLTFLVAALLSVSWQLRAIQSGARTPSPGDANDQQAASSALTQETITFNRDVAPILFANCAGCHRRGEAGPFPLLTYDQVKKHARQVGFVTQTREMPPWLPDAGTFKFKDERRLTADQIATIKKWIDEGEVEGDAKDLPKPPQFSEGWQLGKPDLILRPDQAFELPASGPDQYWNFVLPVPVKQTRWLKAIEVLPEDKRVVHHASVWVNHSGSSHLSPAEASAGFAEMELPSQNPLGASHLFFWKPGATTYVYPDAMSLRLDKGADLILSTHLQPSGKPESVRPSLGLYFAKKAPSQHPMLLLLQNDAAIDIPPRAKRYLVSDEFTIPVDLDLLAVYPHAHYLGEDLGALATFPDGSQKDLIHIRHWDLNWQSVYRYQEPVFLPKGTTISMRYVYNNSEGNVSNPNSPPRRITTGQAITDEMAHLWLQVLPRERAGESDPAQPLEQAVVRHNAQRQNGDVSRKSDSAH